VKSFLQHLIEFVINSNSRTNKNKKEEKDSETLFFDTTFDIERKPVPFWQSTSILNKTELSES
jgi:hypothetical protein